MFQNLISSIKFRSINIAGNRQLIKSSINITENRQLIKSSINITENRQLIKSSINIQILKTKINVFGQLN